MDKCNVEKFNGSDYSVWKFQMEAFLGYHGLMGMVDGSDVRLSPAEEVGGLDKARHEGYGVHWSVIGQQGGSSNHGLEIIGRDVGKIGRVECDEERDIGAFTAAEILRVPNGPER